MKVTYCDRCQRRVAVDSEWPSSNMSIVKLIDPEVLKHTGTAEYRKLDLCPRCAETIYNFVVNYKDATIPNSLL